jgi:signal transduction histidine kinase
VNSVIETVRTFLGPELTRRRVTLSLALGNGLPSVLADAVQLQQVLVTLLINGAEAMEPLETKQRRLELRSTAERDGRLRIDVVDHGPGIDTEARARLFDAFFTTKQNGLGMGLAICKSIIEAHGGRIQPMDRTGPGTTMQVWLPVR